MDSLSPRSGPSSGGTNALETQLPVEQIASHQFAHCISLLGPDHKSYTSLHYEFCFMHVKVLVNMFSG